MSNASDFFPIPLPGLSKPDDNTLKLLRPLAEVQVIASDATITGTDAGSLRLRCVYSAVGAGPNVYFEGVNSAAVNKQVGRIQAAFINRTTLIEESKIVLSVLKGGANVQLAFRGDATANFGPVAIGGVALGTQALPFLEAYVGNTAGTRYVKLTATGPGTDNALITEGGTLSIYNGAQATLVVAANGVSIGSLALGGGATSGVGLTATLASTAGHTGNISGVAAVTTAQATSGNVRGFTWSYAGNSDQGLYISCSVPGDTLDYGVYVDTSVNLAVAAFFQKQRAAAAGSFLVLQNSAALALFTVDVNGNIIFGSTGKKITGDFSNATDASKVMFQTTTATSGTDVGAITNGVAAAGSGFTAYAGPDSAATNFLRIAATTAGVSINSTKSGAGVAQDLTLQASGVTSFTMKANNDLMLGIAGTTTLAAGMVYLTSAAGAPTGVPTVRAGYVPIYFDSTNLFLYFYTGGAWKKSTVYA